jgi:hypothetical protein
VERLAPTEAKEETAHNLTANPLSELLPTALGREGWWWYTWSSLHLTREPLGTSNRKKETAATVGTVITVRTKPWGRKVRPNTDVTSTMLLKERAMWHVDLLLSNDHEIRSYTTAAAR